MRYLTDSTHPMHVKGFSSLHFPLAQYSALELFAAYVQADHVAPTWNNSWAGLGSDIVSWITRRLERL
ncbi:MAG: hypothetical protein JKY24_07835 [Pseudomonadales bacterium]|nr:hypothetical protein [Pseudomonadales bacterium]